MAKKPDRVLKGTRSVAGRGKTRYLVHAETAGMIDEAQGVLPDEINYATILRKAILS